MSNLREEHEEKQRLEKSNFDLTMTVYYLEENLKRFQDGEHAGDLQAGQMKMEVNKLKLQLEDKQVDLEQRNLLLIKSKNAIEALKLEIERLRNENSHQQDLEDRIRRLKQLNEDIENDYRAQIQQLEQQLQEARQLADVKQIENATTEDNVVRMRVVLVAEFFHNLTGFVFSLCCETEPPGDLVRAGGPPPEGRAAGEAPPAGAAHHCPAEDSGAGGGGHAGAGARGSVPHPAGGDGT